jgi:endonuclease/exonuclease/phosphatase family metal-dependent hydrolase
MTKDLPLLSQTESSSGPPTHPPTQPAPLQEVRYDESFGPPGQHSQLEHLRALLPPDYRHYIFQPAMAFHNGGHGIKGGAGFGSAREEEGLAILSRHPIRRSSYLLLPRLFDDGGDGHQRICLQAEVLTPGIG